MANEVTRYDERFAAMAEQYASSEHVGGEFISLKGGVITFQGEEVPGNELIVVILDAVKARLYYAEKYDASAERNAPPKCYAIWREGPGEDEDPGPHISMKQGLHYFEPQNDICRTCPHNEWGSSDTGRGKRCGEKRRLALLPAGYLEQKKGSRAAPEVVLFDEADHYQSADIAFMQVPVTSVKDWARYVTDLAATHRRPPAGAITRIYVVPDKNTTFKVKFELIQLVPDELLDIIFERYDEAYRKIDFGYPPPNGEEAEERPRGRIRR